MKNTQTPQVKIAINKKLHQLLKRASAIESKTIADIIDAELLPLLQKYSFNTLEEWEIERDTMEYTKVVEEIIVDDGFDPNHIPFDTQILGIRRKLDELDREMRNSSETRPDLEKLKFSLLEDLNFAENEALQKQRLKQAEKSVLWEKICRKIPLE